MTPLPLQFLVALLAGWLCRQQREAIESLQEENRVLREQFGGKRLRFTDAQRRRLARKAKQLGRSRLQESSTIVTPETLLRWYRELVAARYDGSSKRSPGRPRIEGEIQRLIIQMAIENPRWGCTRIRRALIHLGYEIGRCLRTLSPKPRSVRASIR